MGSCGCHLREQVLESMCTEVSLSLRHWSAVVQRLKSANQVTGVSRYKNTLHLIDG